MQSKQPWKPVDCKVLNSTVDEDCPENRFRVIVDVNNSVVPDSTPKDGVITAYRTSDPAECYFETKHAADVFLKGFPNDSTQTCYSDEKSKVSLRPGTASRDDISLYKLRAIFPIIACIVSGLTLVYSIYHVSAVYRVARNVRNGTDAPDSRRDFPDDFSLGGRYPSSSPYMTIDRPPRVGYTYGYRRPLSGHDARLLIASLQEKTRTAEANGTCPICLEDFEDGEGKKTVELPCSHEYHEDCAMQWFRKGSCSCPYCNYDLMSDVRGVREKAAREESERQEAEERQANERAESSTTDADEPSSGSFAVSHYPWSWPWWNRETVVHAQTTERQETET